MNVRRTAASEEAARWAAHARASLAEGFCPDGHRLAGGNGNGRWGLCHVCGMTWTAHRVSVSYRAVRGPAAGLVTMVWHDGTKVDLPG